MLTEWQNFGITDMLKTVNPPKLRFAGGIMSFDETFWPSNLSLGLQPFITMVM